MKLLKPELKAELFDFCCQMLVTRDFDPNYFTVKGFCENVGMDREEKMDFCFIFMAFYHFGSADRFWRDPSLDVSKMPFGRSRRGFRANEKSLIFLQAGKELKKYLWGFEGKGEKGWRHVYNMLLSIPGSGHWSAYCFCHCLKIVLDFKITAPNVGFLTSDTKNRGPISGLAFITGLPEKKLLEEKTQKLIYEEMLEGVPFDGMEDFESVLCNYLSLHKKMYYVGRDIDRNLGMMGDASKEWWDARVKYFPDELLGEKHGWDNIRKDLMGVFEPGKKWIQP